MAEKMAAHEYSPASGQLLKAALYKKARTVLTAGLLAPAIVFSLASTITLSMAINFSFACRAVQAQADATASLKNISVDGSHQIIFQYADGAKAAPPQLFEMPSPDHRLIVDLPGTVLDSASMPSADQLSADVIKALPGVKRVRFLTPIKDTPTVRIAFDLAIPAKVKASLHILDGAVSLALNEEYAQPVTFEAAVADATAAAGEQGADVYNQYAKAMVAQNPEQPKDSGEWGPRKGTAAELKQVTKGFKPLVSAAALQAPLLQQDLSATLPGAKAPDADVQAPTPGVAPKAVAEVVPDAPSVTAPEVSSQSNEAIRDTTPDPQITAAAASSASTIQEAAEVVAQDPTPAPVAKVAAVPPVQREPEPVEPEQAAEAPQTAEPAGADSKKVQARRFFNKAVKAHLSGQVAQAIADYKSALLLDPELGDAHSNLGLAYNQQHNYANALTEFRKALAINATDAITYNGVGAALRAQKDVPGAIKNWEAAVKLNPKLAVAHYNLGTAYESQGDLDRAIVSYENATRNDQRLGEAFYRMGLIMLKKHKSEDAKEQFKRALKISENSDYSEDARQRLVFISKAK